MKREEGREGEERGTRKGIEERERLKECQTRGATSHVKYAHFATTSCFRCRLFLLILLNLHHQTSIIEHQSPIINIYTHIHIYKSRHVGHRGGRDSLYLYLQYVQTELCFQPHLFSLSLIQSTDQQLLLST